MRHSVVCLTRFMRQVCAQMQALHAPLVCLCHAPFRYAGQIANSAVPCRLLQKCPNLSVAPSALCKKSVVCAGCCAEFVASRQRIQARPKQFYINLLGRLDELGHDHPDTPYAVEHLWHAIFVSLHRCWGMLLQLMQALCRALSTGVSVTEVD
jgi:Protein of unknown function (DUF3431)